MNAVWTLTRIDSIERTSLYVVIALCAGSLLFLSLSITIGVALGGLIVIVNFHWLRRLVERLMAGKKDGKKALVGEYILKLLFFLAIPCAVIYFRKILFDLNPVAFVIGLSTVFIAICVEGLTGLLKRER
ncbi:MAG: hypothetical protein GTN81_17805 [Proteobacteria bacterium]|nr:hypothetical protein [Pseudomonadota bacterium]